MIDFTVRRNLPLPLGRVGDNGAVRMCFPKHFVDTDLPSGGSYALVYRNPQGGTYPRVITEDAEYVYWIVLDEDTQYEGHGEVELRYMFGEDGAYNSEIWQTCVSPSLIENGEAPAEYQSWVDEVIRNAAAAEDAVEHYPYIDGDTGNWMVWDADAGEWVDTEIHAQGPQGERGETGATGADGPQGPQGVVKVFTLSSLTDYAAAAGAVQEVQQRGTAILRYGEDSRKFNYLYQEYEGFHLAGTYMFVADYVSLLSEVESYSIRKHSYLLVRASGATVTSITLTNDDACFIDPAKTYLDPFIPTEDGQPATKKYVDEKIGAGLYRVTVLDEEDYESASFISRKVHDGNEVIVMHDYTSEGHTNTAFYRLTDYRYDNLERRFWFSTDSTAADVSAIEIKEHPDAWEQEITFYYNS